MQVTVVDRTFAHDFLIGSIQYPCITGLDFLEKWDAVMDVTKGKLRTNFGMASLCGPDHSSLLFPFPAWACEDTTTPPAESTQSPTQGNKQAMDDLFERSCGGLDGTHRQKLCTLLDNFADIFAAKEQDCTHTYLIQHRIDTGNALPIRGRPRHLPLAKRAAAEDKLQKQNASLHQ